MYKKLEEKDTIGICSPAWIPINKRLINGVKYLQNNGYNIRAAENLNKQHGYFAGTEAERLDDLHDLYADTKVKMIICTRGGWLGWITHGRQNCIRSYRRKSKTSGRL